MPRSLNNAPWVAQAGREGRLFGCHFGSLTTPVATAATTAIAARRPMAWARFATGTLMIPVSVRIVVEAAGATTQGEISLCSTTNDVGAGTSTAGTSGALNTNPGSSLTSGVTTFQLATGDVTLETGLIEHARFSFAASAVNLSFNWPDSVNDIPYLRGPASWLLYIGGNAVNFYAQFKWAEYDETAG